MSDDLFPILVVDDAREDLILAEAVLHCVKILNPIHLFTTGEQCQQFLRQRKVPSPFLMFLDLNMYPMSGLDTLRLIGTETGVSQSYIVMLSGIRDIKMVRHGYQLGARTFLIKPLSRDDILGLLTSAKDHICVQGTPDGNVLRWTHARAPHPAGFESKAREDDPFA